LQLKTQRVLSIVHNTIGNMYTEPTNYCLTFNELEVLPSGLRLYCSVRVHLVQKHRL